MQFEQAYSFIMEKLENDLPSYIRYHNAQHTKDVMAAAEYLGQKEGISDKELLLLKTAVLFHDTGFLQKMVGHEEISCELVRKHLPHFGYGQHEIEQICDIIMATQLPQTPTNKLGEILCDADLSYLGEDDYIRQSQHLFHELRYNGIIETQEEWVLLQIDFLTKHRYFTETARKEKNAAKEKVIKKISFGSSKRKMDVKSTHRQEIILDSVFIILGVIIAAIAIKLFLVPNKFFEGGVVGISLLLSEVFHIKLTYLLFFINLPLIIFSYFIAGFQFALKTFISILLLSLAILLLPDFAYTNDKLLISIFGGVFVGIGMGLVMRGGAALDGIEVLALYTLKKTSFTITEIIMGINILIFCFAGLEFGLETCLYAVLTYLAATQSMNYVVEGIQEYTGVTIISGKSEEIKYQLVNKLGRGVTVYKGERGFLPGHFEVSSEVDIIFTVITRMELRQLKKLVYEEDARAFVIASTIKEATGGVLSRKAMH
jgi:uncharacterized membrane-anchored protein YitT (DUF2179 family)/predicted metal-dependent HD superfamily phosphohydrolase